MANDSRIKLYSEKLVKVLAYVPRRRPAYVCMIIDAKHARCGKCGRGLLEEGQSQCRVCHAEIKWLYDAIPTSMYWHGLSPVVTLNLRPVPWAKNK